MSYHLPQTIETEIISFAKKYGMTKVILFGSRARGNHTERSDIDLAVSGGDAFDFFCDLMENAHTLLTFDVVDLDSDISEKLRKNIEKDGVVLYGEAG